MGKKTSPATRVQSSQNNNVSADVYNKQLQEIADFKIQIEDLQEQVRKLEKSSLTSKQQIELTTDIKQLLQGQSASYEQEAVQLKETLTSKESELSNLLTVLDKSQNQITALSEQLEKANQYIADQNEQLIKQRQLSDASLQISLAKNKSKLADLKKELSELRLKVINYRDREEKLIQENRSLKEKYQQQEKNIEEKSRENKKRKRGYEDLEREYKGLESEFKAAKREISDLQSGKTTLEKQIDEDQTIINDLTQQKLQLGKDIDSKTKEIDSQKLTIKNQAETNKQFASKIFQTALKLLSKKDYQNAQSILKELIALYPTTNGLYYYALACSNLNDSYHEAKEALNQLKRQKTSDDMSKKIKLLEEFIAKKETEKQKTYSQIKSPFFNQKTPQSKSTSSVSKTSNSNNTAKPH